MTQQNCCSVPYRVLHRSPHQSPLLSPSPPHHPESYSDVDHRPGKPTNTFYIISFCDREIRCIFHVVCDLYLNTLANIIQVPHTQISGLTISQNPVYVASLKVTLTSLSTGNISESFVRFSPRKQENLSRFVGVRKGSHPTMHALSDPLKCG